VSLAAILCAALSLLFALLWRRTERRASAREQLWQQALRAFARHDYSGAREVSTMVAELKEYNDGYLADALARTATSLETDWNEERRAHRELEDVLASLQDAVLVVDGEARLRFLNAAAIQMFEVRIEDVLGAQILEALPSFGLESAIRTALQEGTHTAREGGLYGPRVRDVLLRVSPVRRSDGSVSGAVAILQDLTEMRRLERVRRDFVANASHELRTPIANIRATAETILDSPEDTELSARFLPHLVSEAERLSLLVSDLLDLAKADAGIDAPRKRFDLKEVACTVSERLAGKAQSNDITVECEGTGDCEVEGDPAGLEQVLFNLLDNALIYTPQGGTVRVHTTRNHIGNTVVVTVADNGIGIPENDLPRVFERFYRVDKARSRVQGGTGLGLAIVKHIVENHGGHVKVESESGKGTTFTVTLPGV
jgi:two-component system phosphate regulon sensor histidine kinase PhoR